MCAVCRASLDVVPGHDDILVTPHGLPAQEEWRAASVVDSAEGDSPEVTLLPAHRGLSADKTRRGHTARLNSASHNRAKNPWAAMSHDGLNPSAEHDVMSAAALDALQLHGRSGGVHATSVRTAQSPSWIGSPGLAAWGSGLSQVARQRPGPAQTARSEASSTQIDKRDSTVPTFIREVRVTTDKNNGILDFAREPSSKFASQNAAQARAAIFGQDETEISHGPDSTISITDCFNEGNFMQLYDLVSPDNNHVQTQHDDSWGLSPTLPRSQQHSPRGHWDTRRVLSPKRQTLSDSIELDNCTAVCPRFFSGHTGTFPVSIQARQSNRPDYLGRATECDRMYGMDSIFPAKKSRFQNSTFAKSPRVSSFLGRSQVPERPADNANGADNTGIKHANADGWSLADTRMNLSVLHRVSNNMLNLKFELLKMSSIENTVKLHHGANYDLQLKCLYSCRMMFLATSARSVRGAQRRRLQPGAAARPPEEDH